LSSKVKVGIISDIHLGRKKINIFLWDYVANKKHNINFSESVVGKKINNRLERAVSHLNELSLDFVVLLGDITQGARPSEFKKAREILEGLRAPYIPVIGGHDIWLYDRGKELLDLSEVECFFGRELTKIASYFDNWEKQKEEFQNYSFDYHGTRLIIIDNNSRLDPSFWKLHEKSRRWLLEKSGVQAERIVIFSHVRLSFKDLKGLGSRKQILNVAGHHHKIKRQEKGKITRIFVNSLFLEPKIPILNLDNSIKIEFDEI